MGPRYLMNKNSKLKGARAGRQQQDQSERKTGLMPRQTDESYLQENLPPTRRPWKWNHLCPFLHTVTECFLSSPISSTTVGIVTGGRVPPQEFPKMAKTKTINPLR